MSNQIVDSLRELGKHRRLVGLDILAHHRRRARRQYAIRLWAGRFLYTAGFVAVGGGAVAVMMRL